MAFYCRFEIRGKTVYGIVEGEDAQLLSGDLFANPEPSSEKVPLSDVK